MIILLAYVAVLLYACAGVALFRAVEPEDRGIVALFFGLPVGVVVVQGLAYYATS